MRGRGSPSAFAIALATAQLGAPSVELGGWLTYWDLERGLQRVESPQSAGLDTVFLFAAALSPEGDIVLLEDPATVRESVRALVGRGKSVWLTIVNDVHLEDSGSGSARARLKDGDLVHRVLSDPARVASHRDGIVALARVLGVAGIDIDYENLDPPDRDRFTDFIASLSSSLGRHQIDLSVTVQPKTRESRSVGPGAADWRGLCPFVDRLQIMLYNEHSGKTGPGPMATPTWMTRVLGFALEQCSSARIVPVLKVSGMAWSPDGSRSLQHDDCIALAEKHGARVERLPDAEVPHFTYEDSEGRTTVFFEDAASIQVKLDLVRRLGFDRAVLWSLGREDPSLLRRLLR